LTRAYTDEEIELRVRNLNGSPQTNSNAGSWLTYWEKFSGQTAYGCFVSGCKNKRSVGARVQKDSASDKNWYIVPLCEECNQKTGQDLDIWELAMLVPVNIAKIARLSPDYPQIRVQRNARSFS
jgi:hypothetical protein